MSRYLLYIALIFLLYQVAKRIMRALMPTPPQQRVRRREPGRVPESRPAQQGPQAEIDYSKIRDADYRDIS